MLLITCPWCGDRDEPEFTYGGEAHVPYPADPEALDDEAWARYLFFRGNPAGPLAERWVHTAGCRRWFHAGRDTRGSSPRPARRRGAAGPAPASTATASCGSRWTACRTTGSAATRSPRRSS